MKADTSLPRRFRFAPVLLLVALMSLFVSAPRAVAAELERPTAHELAAIAAAGGQRLWYHEEEFRRDPLLRARPDQVVILDLESGAGGRRPLRNTIPYHFDETAIFTFCLPPEDAHLRSLTLIEEESREVVVHVSPWSGCRQRTIAAGRYQLVMMHDVRGIEAEGKKAFIHVPRIKGEALTGSTPGSFSASCSSDADGNPLYPFYTFTAPNGLFVAGQKSQTVHTQAAPGDSFLGSWAICPDGSGNYTLRQTGFFSSPSTSFTSSGPGGTDTRIYNTTGTSTKFKLADLGNGQFTLMANFGGTLYPVVVGSDGALHWATSGDPAVFTWVLKYYYIGAPPPLQSGEVALFTGCNYDNSEGTWVFRTDVPDFTSFTFFGVSIDDYWASVKVGPGTPAALYANPNYGGTVQFIGGDIACLDNTPLGNYTASSLKVIPNRQLVAATNECQNCNLSGVDLSNLDLSGGQFQGSTFTGANLANTSLQGASLNNANLNNLNGAALAGTNFVSALLRCTNLSGADLSQAVVLFSGIRPIVTTDFSCRVDLTGASFNLDSFPLTQWRYFNLTGAKINGVTGATLSTTASPLDLSGAILNQAALPQVHLDGANLGCASAASGSVCTQLIETSLLSASLKKVNFVNARLEGAHLDFANLDGANLCAVKLNQSPTTKISATLQGAFLRNVNLAQADLTGALLANANFYSSSASSSCNPSASCSVTSCASAVSATLNNAVFAGAYLAGVDFSGSTPQSVDFSGAYLAGSHFTNANLSQDIGSGKSTNFTGAALQGTTFTNANVTGANFTNAVVDFTHSNGQTLLVQLNPATHIAFPGYTPQAGKTLGCVEFTTTQATAVPGTDTTNLCPDGADGPCSTTRWQMPRTPPPPLPSSCTTATADFNWIFSN